MVRTYRAGSIHWNELVPGDAFMVDTAFVMQGGIRNVVHFKGKIVHIVLGRCIGPQHPVCRDWYMIYVDGRIMEFLA